MTSVVQDLTFRKGRLPNDPSKPRLRLSETLAAAAPPPPGFNGFADVASWGMLGNDNWGDCVFACDGHITEQQTAVGDGQELVVTTGQALAAYSAVTGFDPNAGPPGQNPTDQGAQVQDGLNYLRKSGLAGWKIAAFAELDVKNLTEIKQGTAEFGCLSIGINLPVSAMDQFNNSQPWTPVPGSAIDGGHCVQVVGYDSAWVYVVTWGAIQRMSWSFWEQYVEEAWAIISKDWVSKTGLSLTAFGEEFAAMTGQANPFPAPAPAPTPVPPSPVPTPQPLPPLPPPPQPPASFWEQVVAFFQSLIRALFG